MRDVCSDCGEVTETINDCGEPLTVHRDTGNSHCRTCPVCDEVLHVEPNGDGAFYWAHPLGNEYCATDEEDELLLAELREAVRTGWGQ